MNKYLVSCSIALPLFFACGAPAENELTDEELLGTVEQPVGVAANDGSYYWGVADAVSQPHAHRRCLSGNQTCSLPRTKGPTYKIQNMTTAQANMVRAAVASIDAATNWKFTEATGTTTLTFNNIDNFCNDGSGIDHYACANLTGMGNVLTESPIAIPSTYTEHTEGAIHLDQAAINSFTTNATWRARIADHALKAALLSWMGAGTQNSNFNTPTSTALVYPYDGLALTAGEVCKLNGFLPGSQYGSATTIGYINGVHCAD